MGKVWSATEDVFQLVNSVKEKYHLPRLQAARIAISFTDSKPFANGHFNWGKVSKFSAAAKVWHGNEYDFLLTFSDTAFNDVLEANQREAVIDLLLNCCQVEYIPEMEEGEKLKPKKDEYGRVLYTSEIKLDEDGNPKWKISKLDINVFQVNVLRYGCWCSDLLDLKDAIEYANGKKEIITTTNLVI